MALALAACAAAGGPAAAEVRFPEDSGVIDVTRPPYNARGDGQSDDTAAIQQALLDHPDRNAVIYLPTGTYRISQTLKWPWTEGIDGRQRATILQGQSRTGTVIRLGDRTPAFGSGSRGHPMLWMGQELSTHARNAIRDLTVDIGIGNPGATGIRLMANHQGGLRNVTVRAPDPTQGVVGIDLAHAEIVGPCLLRDVAVEGFEYGIQAAYSLNSVTLEHVMLTGQRMAAVRNSGQTLTFRDLQTRGEGPAIQSTDRTGFVTVVGGRFEGLPTRRPSPAVLNRAFLFLQDVTTPGYTNAVQAPSRDREGAAGPEVPLYLSHDAFNLHPAPHLPIGLEVRETPAPDWDPPSGWASPLAHGGRPDDTGDDTAAIQAAIDSGATTVYLPNGTWNVRSTIEIRGRVHRVVGCEARINNDGMRGQPVFRVGPEGAPRVHVERLEVVPGYDPLVEQAGDRTLVLSACHQAALTCSGRGDLFIEDVSSLRPLRDPREPGLGPAMELRTRRHQDHQRRGHAVGVGPDGKPARHVDRHAERGAHRVVGGAVRGLGRVQGGAAPPVERVGGFLRPRRGLVLHQSLPAGRGGNPWGRRPEASQHRAHPGSAPSHPPRGRRPDPVLGVRRTRSRASGGSRRPGAALAVSMR